jgi:hypothetical protein
MPLPPFFLKKKMEPLLHFDSGARYLRTIAQGNAPKNKNRFNTLRSGYLKVWMRCIAPS